MINYPLLAFFARAMFNGIYARFFKKAAFYPTNRTIFAPHLRYKNIADLAENLGDSNYIYIEYMWHFAEFVRFKNEILALLTPRFTLDSANQKILSRIKTAQNPCLIHIRRGDFKGVYELLDMDYYTRAMDFMRAKLGRVEFFVFGNDADFMRENFKGENVIDLNDEAHIARDFVLMRACKHAILANSTLSIWLGFLCEGVVVYKEDLTPKIPREIGGFGV